MLGDIVASLLCPEVPRHGWCMEGIKDSPSEVVHIRHSHPIVLETEFVDPGESMRLGLFGTRRKEGV